jgi:serralysin
MAQTIIGTQGDDKIVQKITDVTEIRARAGNDVVRMLRETSSDVDLGAGNDFYLNLVQGDPENGDDVRGGTGNDRFKVATFSSNYDGGAGDDLFEFAGDRVGANTFFGGKGTDTISYRLYTGGTAVDIEGYEVNLATGIVIPALTGEERVASIENIIGSVLNDILIGNGGANRLEGGEGTDTLNGAGGSDILVGGGAAGDFMLGGSGADLFVFIKSDIGDLSSVILDFDASAEDRIDLSAIDANDRKGGDQAFKFIGDAAFSDKAGELQRNGSAVEADIDGDGLADLRIDVTADDGALLRRADFIL